MKENRDFDRLYPTRLNSRFYHLVALRDAIKSIADEYLSKGDSQVLVDFGCGGMPYRSIIEPHVAQYLGVDLPANEKADSPVSTDGKMQLPDEFANVVLSTQVLEHVGNPMEYLRECHRILKPGGLLILSTHGYWKYHPDPADYWRWSSDGLRRIVEESAFIVIRFAGLMGLAPTAMQLMQDAIIPKSPKLVRPLMIYAAQSLIVLLDRIHSPMERNKDACTYVVVASKQ